MESVAEVPEEASGLRQPRFWIRVFLLLDRLPAKANEPCLPITVTYTHTHTHTHNHFTAFQTFSETTRVSWYQKVHFAIFWIFWSKMKITQANTPTIWMDCHPIETNWCPISAIPTIFTTDALPGTTLSIYPGLGQAPNMLACIRSGLVKHMTFNCQTLH